MPTIGSVELLIVILVAFLVVGPRDLPRLMRRAGEWVRRIRIMANEFQHNLDVVVKEADLEDLKNDVVAIRNEARDIKNSIQKPLDEALKDDTAPKPGTIEQKPSGKTEGTNE